MRRYRDVLENDGHVITSRWIDEEPSSPEGEDYTDTNQHEWPVIAEVDVDDVYHSDVVVFFSEQPRAWTRGGRHVEFGMGLALGKEMVVVGPVENVFHTLPKVKRFDEFEWARLWLREKDKEWQRMTPLLAAAP